MSPVASMVDESRLRSRMQNYHCESTSSPPRFSRESVQGSKSPTVGCILVARYLHLSFATNLQKQVSVQIFELLVKLRTMIICYGASQPANSYYGRSRLLCSLSSKLLCSNKLPGSGLFVQHQVDSVRCRFNLVIIKLLSSLSDISTGSFVLLSSHVKALAWTT